MDIRIIERETKDPTEMSPIPLSDLLDQSELDQVDEALEELWDDSGSQSDDSAAADTEKLISRESDADKVRRLLSTKYDNMALLHHQFNYSPLSWMFVSKNIRYCCDECDRMLGVYERRYTCIDCGNFDLCSECYPEVFAKHNEEKHLNKVTQQVENYFAQITEKPYHSKKSITNEDCSAKIMINALKYYSERPAFGERLCSIDQASGKKEYLDTYQWFSFGQMLQRVENIASGMMNYLNPRDFVGICAPSGCDWVAIDFACLRQSFVTVPIPHNMMPEDISCTMSNSSIKALFFASEYLKIIIDALSVQEMPDLKYMIQIDGVHSESVLAQIENIRTKYPHIQFLSLNQIESQGEGNPVDLVPTAQEDIVTVVYTSGSTGTPKGAVFTDRIWTLELSDAYSTVFPRVTVCIFPMSHMSGRLAVQKSIVAGGKIGFPTQDMSTLFEDIRLISPSILSLVPRVADMIYQHYQKEFFQERSLNPGKKESIIGRRVRNRMRNMFGHRLVRMTIGSAPSNPRVVLLLKQIFTIPIIEGYGSTEGGSISLEGVKRTETDIKLLDVPELNYLSTDEPYPRGELCVKSNITISQYYKNPEATQTHFDEDGYFKTGDIVELRPRNEIVLIDRKNFIFKLSNGEFVSPSRLELMFSSSPFIQQMFIHGDSLYSYLVAVVVPNDSVVQTWMKDNNINEDQKIDDLKRVIRKELQEIALKNQIRSYEIPRDFIIDFTGFKENGLLTISNKLARAKLKQYYWKQLNEVYEKISEIQDLKLAQQYQREGTVTELVKSAVEVVLGMDILEPETSYFMQLGGDSISAVRLVSLIQQSCNVSIPLSMVIDPTVSVRMLQLYTETIGDSVSTDKESETQEMLRSEDIHLGTKTIQLLTNLPMARSKGTCNILLTGANGYLGRFILSSLLKVLPDCRIYAMVRAIDDSSAAEKLVSSFYGRLDIKDTPVTVVRGDISKDRFGLTDEEYSKLSESIDVVVHNAALVNHAFSYDDLFSTNVKGTEEVIQFAATDHRKAIHYISSISSYGDLTGYLLEDTDMRLSNDRTKRRGYATSKWASEILIERAREYGITATIIRPTLMLGDHLNGDSNISDWFVRLLTGVVETKLCPTSFYTPNQSICFDAIPVDYASDIVANIVKREIEGELYYYRFNLVSKQDETTASLDTIFGWVESYGYSLKRVSHYDQWYEQICNKIVESHSKSRALPPWSLLPMLRSFKHPIGLKGSHYSDLNTQSVTGPSTQSLIDEDIIHKILKFLIDRQVLDQL